MAVDQIAAVHAMAQEPADTLRIPAFTAYSEPDPDGARFSERRGVTGWTDGRQKVAWYGHLKATGKLSLALVLRLPAKESATLRLTAAHQSRTVQASGSEDGGPITVSFGSVDISKPGYYQFALEGVAKSGRTFGDLEALVLSGPAVKEAHFNLVERRNAASVHLHYPLPTDTQAAWFYNEVTVKTDPLWSFYMACGFRRGYFGIQVNSPTERRIIFSVWDSGNEAVDRNKVAAEDKVQLLAKGEGVVAESFGNEGTGGHSHLVYPWKTGQTYRFLVAAQPEGTHTTYSGYFYFPEKKAWGLIARFRAPKDGAWLRGLHSFNENFVGSNGQQRRLAEFGNQWVRTSDGKWQELTTARFTHDPTGKKDRLDYDAGLAKGRFFLSNGGFLEGKTHYGDEIKRSAVAKPPSDIPQTLP